MDFNSTIDIIIKDLKEARAIIDDLKNYPGIPHLQVELAKSKCKSAEEVIALLKSMNSEPSATEVIINKAAKEIIPTVPLRGEELIEISDQAEEVQAAVPQIGPVRRTDKTKTSKPEEKHPETNILADKFSSLSGTINEQLGTIKNDDDISAILKSRPVSNLSEAIGINDKFLFVREIFSGDQGSYNEAISKLNKVENISDAKAVIMSYTGEGEESEAVRHLLDLVKRKLPSDE
jgi:hypothetical protein